VAVATPAAVSGRPQFSIITKALTANGEEETPRFSAIASSTIVDRAGDEITLRALEKMQEQFRAGLTIFVDHNKSAYNAFGTTDTADIREGGNDKDGNRIWDLHIGGVVNQPSPRAMELWRSMSGGFVKFGASIGAFVVEHERRKGGGIRIDDIDAYEASIVGVPMNQRSWAYYAAKAVKSLYGDPDMEDAAMGDQVILSNGLDVTTSNTTTTISTSVEKEMDEAEVAKAVCPSCGGDGPNAIGDCKNAYHSSDWDEKASDTDHDGDNPAAGDDPDNDGKSADALIAASDDTKEATLDAPEAVDAATPETATEDGQEAPEATPETASADKALVAAPEDVVELIGHVRKMAAAVSDRDEKIAALSDRATAAEAERDRLALENEEAKRAIERLLSLPLRRQAVGVVSGLSRRLPDFFDPSIQKTLDNISGDND